MKQNIIILLLVCLIVIQLVIMKQSHDNSYRLSSVVKILLIYQMMLITF